MLSIRAASVAVVSVDIEIPLALPVERARHAG
jgi:hypothetical protein